MGKNLLTASSFAAGMSELSDELKAVYVRLNDADYKNLIDQIKVNGTALTPDANKAVNVTVPTKVSDITNDSNFQTDTQVNTAIANAISTVYKAGGSVATVSELPALAANVQGYVYDFTAEFTTTSDFKEGAGKTYPIGTNVVVVNTDTTETSPVYKYDVLPGFVDLSNYLDTSSAGNGISIDAQKKINIDPAKFIGQGGIEISINNGIVTNELSSSTLATLGKASSALQLADITTGNADGITLTKDSANNTINIAAKLKASSAGFTNALKKDADGMYVELEYATKTEVENAVDAAFTPA